MLSPVLLSVRLFVTQLDQSTTSQAVARIVDRTTSQHLWGHVTSSVTWPFDTPYVISYWYSFGTESLSPAIFEIFHSKRIGITSLTFQGIQGHVTSSGFIIKSLRILSPREDASAVHAVSLDNHAERRKAVRHTVRCSSTRL